MILDLIVRQSKRSLSQVLFQDLRGPGQVRLVKLRHCLPPIFEPNSDVAKRKLWRLFELDSAKSNRCRFEYFLLNVVKASQLEDRLLSTMI